MSNVQIIHWTPKNGDMYYYFNSKGKVEHQPWQGGKRQLQRLEFGVVFRTKEDAAAARDAVADLLTAYWLNHGGLLIKDEI